MSAPRRRAKNNARFERVRTILAERFPAAFTEPRLLKVGVFADICAELGAEISSADLNRFFWIWTRTSAYIVARGRADRRVDLTGADAGPANVEPPIAAPAERERAA